MNPADRDRVHFLFGEAADLPVAERAAYLDRHCGTGTIREAVECLLVEHECAAGLLDQPLFPSPPSTSEDPWKGRVLHSRYRIHRYVASGGMSRVYLAHDEHLAGRAVIVKFLPAWAPQYAWLKTKFRQEMEALARIDHHAVVGVLDTGETPEGVPFLVMEYIDGVTLRSEMRRPMPRDRVASLIRQIARAVEAAHAKGVLHRDLKPENIMLEHPGTSDECVRLIDFGIARLAESEGDFASHTTQFAGTTPYMAPEQLRGKPSPASDTYSMAVVAYEMLAGQRPFSGAGPIEIYEQQRAGADIKPLLHCDVPEAAARMIVRQLAFCPEDRSASGSAIADALLHPCRQLWTRRHTVVALAGGGVAAASAAFVATTSPLPLSATQRGIELPPGTEPTEHGFEPRGIVDNQVIWNADATVLEAVRVITTDQGGYYHRLNAAQADAANRFGWRATVDLAVEEGGASVNVDVQHSPRRYTLNVLSAPGEADLVRLLRGFTPALHGIDIPLPGPPGVRHRYVLEFAAGSKTADLLVDGVKRYSGYSGLTEYAYQRGPEIGVARYRSARGVGVFWGFRFEINAPPSAHAAAAPAPAHEAAAAPWPRSSGSARA